MNYMSQFNKLLNWIRNTFRNSGMRLWVPLIVFTFMIILIVLRIMDVWEIFLPGASDNARYFLSAVAQSLAALFALVITISLIIMQLLTQTYTNAIFAIYIKRPIVLVTYFVSGFVIVFSLYVLLQIQNGHVCKAECMKTDIIFILVTFSVVWNIIYFWDILAIVKPDNFLKMIDAKLNRGADKKRNITLIAEICDISMKKGDMATSNSCLLIFERVSTQLAEEDKAHLGDTLKKLFEKAIERDSAEMIYAILRIAFYNPIMRFYSESEQL